MAMMKCAECGNDVSSTAAACPSCGAPPKAFFGKPKSFKDRFSAARTDMEIANAKAEKAKAGASMAGCFWTGIALVILILALIVIF